METNTYKLSGMITEQANPGTKDLDTMPIRGILHTMNEEDKNCALAVEKVLPQIECIVEQVVERFGRGGRILYMGAGTSGRIAIMDAAEIPPTFGIDADRVQATMAGGKASMVKAQEAREDDSIDGAEAIREWNPTEVDCVIGLATSGKTPYVLAGLKAAKEAGAFTAFICANPVPNDIADVVVSCITGPEVLTGSTRLKAGTAQKMILNMISTASMVKLGRVYQNRMSHIAAGNKKLRSRAIETLTICCDISESDATQLLDYTNGELPVALVVGITKCDKEKAKEKLEITGGKVRAAVAMLRR